MGMSEMAEQMKTSQEPSMEEILSSIRRIIADEDTTEPPAPARAAAPAPATPAPAAVGEDEVLELTHVVEPPRAEQQRPEPPPPPTAARPAAPEWQPRAEPPPRSQPMASEAANSLISPSAANASAQALAKLARVGTADPRETGGLGELTVEKLLRDLLTPLLKDWLDQNLPAVVERVVEQEVKKLARRAELL